MKYAAQIIVGVAIVFAVVLFSVYRGGSAESSSSALSAGRSQAAGQPQALGEVLTGTTETGDVAIALKPALIGNELVVAISANTHSVDLSQFDLVRQTTLSFSGRTIKPSAAPQLSGHHASGELQFPVSSMPGKFKITIVGIPQIQKRVYEWG